MKISVTLLMVGLVLAADQVDLPAADAKPALVLVEQPGNPKGPVNGQAKPEQPLDVQAKPALRPDIQAKPAQRPDAQAFPKPAQAQQADAQRTPRGQSQSARYENGPGYADNYNRRPNQSQDYRNDYDENYVNRARSAPQGRYNDQRKPLGDKNRPHKRAEVIREKDGTMRLELARIDDDSHDDGFIEVGSAWRVRNVAPEGDKDQDDKPVKWNIHFVDSADGEKVKELEAQKNKDKKEIEKREDIVKNDLKLLDKVQKIESKELTADQAIRAQNLEEKLSDQVRREERKIDALKADEQKAKTTEKLIKTISELNKIEGPQTTQPATKEEKISQIFDNKLREARNKDLAQQIMAPKVLEQMKSELKRLDREDQDGRPKEKIRSPEVKEIVVTGPLKPDTPLAETLVKAMEATNRTSRAAGALIVGSSNK